MKRLIFDYETRSMADLKRAGAFKYSLHETTQPTCMAFKIKGNPKVYFLDFKMVNTPWAKLPEKFKTLWLKLIEEKYLFCGHNIFFDMCIYRNIAEKRYGWPLISARQYRCTAAKAAACALPRSLGGAGEALKLDVQKDKRGLIAMMATCRPTKYWTAWNKLQNEIKSGVRISEKKRLKAQEPEPKVFCDYADNPAVWETLYEYCRIDVLAEERLDDALPDLIPIEQESWFLNQELNWEGLRIDISTVKKIIDIMNVESKTKLKELDSLTMGLVTKPGARQSIIDFLALEGVELKDIRAGTVKDTLQSDKLTDDARRLLELRQALSKTSTKKYQSFIDRAAPDGYVRDILMFHGAATGRDSGTGIQPQNFPRGLIAVDKARPYAAIENVIECDKETLNFLYGESLGILFSAVLRNVIIASPGCQLFVADYSKIEVVVCWWIADNLPGLKVLASGKDPYKYQAAANTGKTYDQIADSGPDRQLGKAQILGCQYGMGADKFQSTAWDQYRLKLSDDQSKHAVYSYREANKAVTELWKNVERAAIAAVESGETVTTNMCKFFCKDNFLWIELPSGRRLAYRDPQISWRESEYGARKTLEFWGVNPKTKKWAVERTWGGTLTENIVSGIARDIMKHGELLLKKADYKVKLLVHDEVVSEKRDGNLKDYCRILCTPPTWADKKLFIAAEGYAAERYRK